MINAKPRNAIEINQLASALHSAEAKGVPVQRLHGTEGTTLYSHYNSVQVNVHVAPRNVVSVNDLCAALNDLI